MKEDKTDNDGYRRVGSNLYRTEALTLKEALLGGWEIKIPFFDQYDPFLTLSRKKGVMVQNGEVEVIKGKGMPIFHGNDEYGDLFIEYVVVFPTNSKKLKQLHDEL